ncbi:MAG TPA: hypothetical protein VFB81_02755, partial [Myxococcales bacterium]|nr:hypothetical protein [Myxococcales bacterium]
MALGLAPSVQAVTAADSFESWPGVWTVSPGTMGSQIDAGQPSQDPDPSTRAVGAWDGKQALKVVYGGNTAGTRPEAVASAGGSHQSVALRLMVYVPRSTVANMSGGQVVQIARMMTSETTAGADIAISLVRSTATGNGAIWVQGFYQGVTASTVGGPTATDIAPDTWHTIELTCNRGVVADLDLYVDDLTSPAASAPGLTVLSRGIGAVAVGLTRDLTQNSQPLVWWIDDVAAGPGRIGHGSPRVHFHQDGFEV